eukprot:GEMP01000668.1.p1 GENE.GEMP01000668.1~~GEMP01000668.1.p1  ORF type:complete len:1775 (+),score=410.32 GEMP01000668.1:168-5492(+)
MSGRVTESREDYALPNKQAVYTEISGQLEKFQCQLNYGLVDSGGEGGQSLHIMRLIHRRLKGDDRGCGRSSLKRNGCTKSRKDRSRRKKNHDHSHTTSERNGVVESPNTPSAQDEGMTVPDMHIRTNFLDADASPPSNDAAPRTPSSLYSSDFASISSIGSGTSSLSRSTGPNARSATQNGNVVPKLKLSGPRNVVQSAIITQGHPSLQRARPQSGAPVRPRTVSNPNDGSQIDKSIIRKRPKTERSSPSRRAHRAFASSLNPYRTVLTHPKLQGADTEHAHARVTLNESTRQSEGLQRSTMMERQERSMLSHVQRHAREEKDNDGVAREAITFRKKTSFAEWQRDPTSPGLGDGRAQELCVSDAQQARMEGVRLSQCRNRFESLEMSLVSKHIPKSEMMVQFLQKQGIDEKRKVFVFDGPDEHIRQSLLRRQFVENPHRASVLWDFKWCVTDLEEDYKSLRDGDLYNHFQNNRELTTKAALTRNLRQFQSDEPAFGQSDDFFPRSYDMSNPSERDDFTLDFCRQCAFLVLQRHRKLLRSTVDYVCNLDVLRVAKHAFRQWTNELRPDVDAIFREISMDDWDSLVVYSELSEGQLCQQEEEEELGLGALRRERKRGYRSAGGICGGGDNVTPVTTRADLTISRPADIQKWDEFKEHMWGPPSDLEPYIVEIMDQISLLPQQHLLGPLNVWIVKPGTNSKGSGIQCMHRLREILHHCDSVTNRVVQKYIERPLLLYSGRKFDIRQWVIVRSFDPLDVYMFTDCYLRLCNEPFDLGDLANRQRHISNWAVNKTGKNVKAGGYIEGGCAPLSSFKEALLEISGNPQYWEEVLVPHMERIILTTLGAAQNLIVQRPQCFELFGFDVMVDQDLNPWLLEVNLSPACDARTPFIARMLERMSESMLCLILDGKEEKHNDGYWRCICADTSFRQRADESLCHHRFPTITDDSLRMFAGDLVVVGKPLYFRHERKLELGWLRQKGAHFLQRVGRGFLVRTRARQQRCLRSARLFQRLWRGVLGRRRAQRRREFLRARMLQAAIRTMMAQKHVRCLQLNKGSVALQKLFRGVQGRRHVVCVRRTRRATAIQRHIRGWRTRRHLAAVSRIVLWWRVTYAHRVRHALRLQRTMRMVWQRRRYAILLEQRRALIKVTYALAIAQWRTQATRLRRHLCARYIQARIRGIRGRRFCKARRMLFNTLGTWCTLVRREVSACQRIQRWVRGVNGRREAFQRRRNARTLQIRFVYAYRARQRRRRLWDERCRVAALQIQCAWRGYCGRLFTLALKSCQNACRHVQRVWRGRCGRAFVKSRRAFLQRRRKWLELEAKVEVERAQLAAQKSTTERFRAESEQMERECMRLVEEEQVRKKNAVCPLYQPQEEKTALGQETALGSEQLNHNCVDIEIQGQKGECEQRQEEEKQEAERKRKREQAQPPAQRQTSVQAHVFGQAHEQAVRAHQNRHSRRNHTEIKWQEDGCKGFVKEYDARLRALSSASYVHSSTADWPMDTHTWHHTQYNGTPETATAVAGSARNFVMSFPNDEHPISSTPSSIISTRAPSDASRSDDHLSNQAPNNTAPITDGVAGSTTTSTDPRVLMRRHRSASALCDRIRKRTDSPMPCEVTNTHRKRKPLLPHFTSDAPNAHASRALQKHQHRSTSGHGNSATRQSRSAQYVTPATADGASSRPLTSSDSSTRSVDSTKTASTPRSARVRDPCCGQDDTSPHPVLLTEQQEGEQRWSHNRPSNASMQEERSTVSLQGSALSVARSMRKLQNGRLSLQRGYAR